MKQITTIILLTIATTLAAQRDYSIKGRTIYEKTEIDSVTTITKATTYPTKEAAREVIREHRKRERQQIREERKWIRQEIRQLERKLRRIDRAIEKEKKKREEMKAKRQER